MKRQTILNLAGGVVLLAGCAASRTDAPKAAAPQAPTTTAASATEFPQVKTLRLADATDPTLPEGAARDVVQMNCGMCHTSRYIMLQPPFTREVWTAEVTKMRTTFSGPIPVEQVPAIVDYLVSVNGAPSPVKK